MTAATGTQINWGMYCVKTLIESPITGFALTSELAQRAVAKHPINYVWVTPMALVANLVSGALSILCGVVILIALPIFVIAAYQRSKQLFNVTKGLVFLAGCEILGALPMAILNTCRLQTGTNLQEWYCGVKQNP